ncbi:hypothetical protein B0H65DRAFT_506006 [Neurospora tetraspora]|uniref:Uncharacterized protein n=1 Tax=Neurospora tetraspora TaxID=94610 RepID=A0AAE0JRS0_9PEZI|nr:hypothetical protein B0H65DRAFT_506006 [Neurospora tetraspora]
MPEITRTYNNPLASHQARHHHDLRSGPQEPSGGETRAQHEADKPKHPVDEAFRPSHVLGAEKNIGAPEKLDAKNQKEGGALTGGGLKETLDMMATEEYNPYREGKKSQRLQEGLPKGVGGLEGRGSGFEGAGERVEE